MHRKTELLQDQLAELRRTQQFVEGLLLLEIVEDFVRQLVGMLRTGPFRDQAGQSALQKQRLSLIERRT